MKSPFVRALVGALLSMPLVHAQVSNCPMQTAQTIQARTKEGPRVDCADMQWSFAGLSFSTRGQGCPLFVTFIPEHELAQASSRQTWTRLVAVVPEQTAFFNCKTEWFLFLPIGTRCQFNRIVNSGSYMRLVTEPCASEPIDS